MQQPKAKRQRVPLTEQTFVNPDVRPEMAEVKPDRPVAMLDAQRDGIENMAVPKRDLGIRAKKPKASERVNKGDGSTVLVGTSLFLSSHPIPSFSTSSSPLAPRVVCLSDETRSAPIGAEVIRRAWAERLLTSFHRRAQITPTQ